MSVENKYKTKKFIDGCMLAYNAKENIDFH